jgi:hypothetical protein
MLRTRGDLVSIDPPFHPQSFCFVTCSRCHDSVVFCAHFFLLISPLSKSLSEARRGIAQGVFSFSEGHIYIWDGGRDGVSRSASRLGGMA